MKLVDKQTDEQEIWDAYLRLVNLVNRGNKLADKEILVVSYILSLDINTSYFTKKNSKIISKNIPNCGYSELVRIKDKLLTLGILKEFPNPDDLRSRFYFFNMF